MSDFRKLHLAKYALLNLAFFSEQLLKLVAAMVLSLKSRPARSSPEKSILVT